jgi:hypothetical protein
MVVMVCALGSTPGIFNLFRRVGGGKTSFFCVGIYFGVGDVIVFL